MGGGRAELAAAVHEAVAVQTAAPSPSTTATAVEEAEYNKRSLTDLGQIKHNISDEINGLDYFLLPVDYVIVELLEVATQIKQPTYYKKSSTNSHLH
uniref:Uncharacterized protein n=1 Tax=Oryza sativa subsp. japonica TaxID=39947 RepID=Q5VPM0_ORYSJ|nr:hypothetical protein [Oryza sativa Japonica Group]